MIAWLRKALRRWLVPEPVQVAHDPQRGLSIHPELLAMLPGLDHRTIVGYQGMPVVRRDVQPPKLFPGVLPTDPASVTCDGMGGFVACDANAPAFQWATQVNCGLGFPGYAYLAELTQRSEYRAPAETIASELTREWIVVKTEGKAEGEGDDSPNDLAGGEGNERPGAGKNQKPPKGEKPAAKKKDAPPVGDELPGDDDEEDTDEQTDELDDADVDGGELDESANPDDPGELDGEEDDEADPGELDDPVDPDQVDEEDVDALGGEEGSGAEDKIEKINAALDKHKIRDKLRKIAELDSEFGRAQLFIDIDHGKGEDAKDGVRKLPLLVGPETIPAGSLRGFTVVEPLWTTPYYYNANDPTAEDFYKPRAWFVLGKLIHASRMLTFVSREVPDMLKPAYNFGGMSLTQLMEPYVYQWLRTRNSVSDLVHNFSVIALKTDLAAVLGGGDKEDAASLLNRAKVFTQTRDNQGLMLLDFDKEDLQQIAVPLSGLGELQAQAQEHMAAPSHIPLVKLLGVTPSGLNASSEGEIKVFYDYVRALQQSFFAEHLKTIIDIIQLDLFGTIDDAITFEFVPLTSPSVKELSEIRKSDSDAGVRYIEAGVISPEEERERLMADPTSGYTNLSGPAPEPPPMEINPMTGEPEGGPGSLVPGAGKGGEKGPPKKPGGEAEAPDNAGE